ncbi:MAG: hypothetical protein IKU02_06515 [Bacteroidaceae bacterium]|nr:hypothetical protein [Bacteroidaceae bacterium]
METTIRNKGGESTLITKIDFYQLLDENFNEVCKAIANKVRILKELKCQIDEGRLQIDNLVRIIKSSLFPEEAVRRISEEMGLSKMAAKYLMNMSLGKMVSLSSEGLEQELEEYWKQMDAISSLCQPKFEFDECKELNENAELIRKNHECKNV